MKIRIWKFITIILCELCGCDDCKWYIKNRIQQDSTSDVANK
jgi:hypothetical protein